MSSAFFYRERRGMFVVVILTIWLVLLMFFGRYLPAAASVSSKQMSISMSGRVVTGNWVKENGIWRFSKVLKVSTPLRKIAHSKAPVTTSSMTVKQDRKIRKRAARARLADEIGRWAKIGNRWEWQQSKMVVKPMSLQGSVEQKAQWVSRGGIWVFEVVDASEIIRDI